MRGRRRLSLCAALWFSTPAQASEVSVTGFAGHHTANVWEEVVTLDDVRFLDARFLGVSLGAEWPVAGPVSLGVEAQLSRHWGTGGYWEVAIPATIRVRSGEDAGPVRGAAFGLGLSRTSREPRIEAERTGQARRILFYWFLEAEFGTPDPKLTAVLRLHHRSSGFGFFGDSGSSNAIAVGVRRRF